MQLSRTALVSLEVAGLRAYRLRPVQRGVSVLPCKGLGCRSGVSYMARTACGYSPSQTAGLAVIPCSCSALRAIGLRGAARNSRTTNWHPWRERRRLPLPGLPE